MKDLLSLEKSNTIKAIMCILILFHHLYQYTLFTDNPIFGGILQNLGFWSVSIFFFLSGYGLAYSHKNKKDYIDKFLKAKLLPLYISYIFFAGIYFIYNYFFAGIKLNLFQVILTLTFGATWNSLWYLQALCFLYLLFYISHRFKNNDIILLLSALIYYFVCKLLLLPYQWYVTYICFFVGILYFDNCKKINELINRRYLILTIISLICFLITFLMSKFLFFNSLLFENLFFSISNIFFVISFFIILSKFNFENKFLIVFSKYSLEFYSIQFIFLEIFRNNSLFLYVVLVTALTFVFAYITHVILNFIKKILFGNYRIKLSNVK